MSELIQIIGDSNCGDCSQSIKIKGCANNVPYLQIVTSTGVSPATVTFINLIDGVISATAPAGYVTGDCPAYEEVDLVKTNWLPICVAGVQWYVLESSTYNNATLTETTPVKLYKQGANGAIVTVPPVGVVVEGICAIPLTKIPVTVRVYQSAVGAITVPANARREALLFNRSNRDILVTWTGTLGGGGAFTVPARGTYLLTLIEDPNEGLFATMVTSIDLYGTGTLGANELLIEFKN